jgi:hypothetical protein
MNPLAEITNKDEIGVMVWRVEIEQDKKKLGTASL